MQVAIFEVAKVDSSRTEQLLEECKDFALVSTRFDDAHSSAGRAVAVAWASCRSLAQPNLATDAARVQAMAAEVAQIKKVESAMRETAKWSHKRAVRAKRFRTSSLKQQERGAEPGEMDGDRSKFVQPFLNVVCQANVLKAKSRRATRVYCGSSLEGNKVLRDIGSSHSTPSSCNSNWA